MKRTLKSFSKQRSAFGGKKYLIDNPDKEGPWGAADQVELFWFRHAAEDMREELADANVYSDKLRRQHWVVSLPSEVRDEIDECMADYQSLLKMAWDKTIEMDEILGKDAPELLKDKEWLWGKFSSRLRFDHTAE